jgi:hypothetical protein
MDRQCRAGGFCFYKLEEPNGLDTYCALSLLSLLDISFNDEKTIAYLQNMQNADGSYDGIFAAFYSLKSLLLLDQESRQDPWPYILKHIRYDRVDADRMPAEITSVFKRMVFLVDLYVTYNKTRDERIENNLQDFVLYFHNKDQGFGHHQSTLGETSKALVLLSLLDYPVQELHTTDFIGQCETSTCGFTDIPDTSLSYLEYIHAGVLAAFITDYRIRYADECVSFIRHCQNRTGGFSRVMHGGIATLEDTFHAAHALKLLSVL